MRKKEQQKIKELGEFIAKIKTVKGCEYQFGYDISPYVIVRQIK